jgi:hypothetical protein
MEIINIYFECIVNCTVDYLTKSTTMKAIIIVTASLWEGR